MRTALLLLTLVAALSVAPSDARANFNCFQTPDGEHRCACVGADNCSAMQKSHLADLRHHINLGRRHPCVHRSCLAAFSSIPGKLIMGTVFMFCVGLVWLSSDIRQWRN
jgi:hypothetical protein